MRGIIISSTIKSTCFLSKISNASRPSLAKIGSYPFWGADTREELEALAPGLRCQKMLRVISQAQLQKLSLLQRVQFRLLDGSGETALRAAVCRLPGGNPPEQTPEEPKTDAEKKPPLP